MEKPIIETETERQQQPSQTYTPQTFPPATHIHRKPLPKQSAAQTTVPLQGDAIATAQAEIQHPTYAHIPPRNVPEKEYTVQEMDPKQTTSQAQGYNYTHTRTQTHNDNDNYHQESKSSQSLQLPPRPPRTPFHTRLKSKWHLLPRRKKILYLTPILLLLLLIIILSATLTHKSPFSNLPLPSSHGGPYTGDLTYYVPGLGACGLTSTSSDFIVAVSHVLFDAVSVGSNPNANPLCGRRIRATREGRSVDLTVVDRCVGCQARDLDVTVTVFGGLADVDLGRVSVSWAWLDDVPGAVAGG